MTSPSNSEMQSLLANTRRRRRRLKKRNIRSSPRQCTKQGVEASQQLYQRRETRCALYMASRIARVGMPNCP